VKGCRRAGSECCLINAHFHGSSRTLNSCVVSVKFLSIGTFEGLVAVTLGLGWNVGFCESVRVCIICECVSRILREH
jgi:hypothetical protein